MNKPKQTPKKPPSVVINKRVLAPSPINSQVDFTPEQLHELAFRCERALISPVQPVAMEFDEWA